ncbi:hypothetical protein ACF0H5_005542 [Mactra antiquata]
MAQASGKHLHWMVKVLEAIVAVNPDNVEHNLNDHARSLTTEQLAIPHNGENVLSTAIGNLDCVKILLKYGANASQPGERGLQPIHSAVMNDLVEAMMFLCLYGADFNTHLDENDIRKSLLMKAIEHKTTTCYDALHFLGAQIPDDQIDKLLKSETTKQNYLTIQEYYRDRTIRNNICTIDAGNLLNIPDRFGNSFGLTIMQISQTTNIFVCRMLPEYLAICNSVPKIEIPDRAKPISDVYVYKVNSDATCTIDIQLQRKQDEIHNKYKEIIVHQFTRLDGTNPTVEITGSNVQFVGTDKVRVTDFNLMTSSNSTFITFAVFERNKVDSNLIKAGEDKTVTSTTENKFRVHARADSDLDCQIDMEVVETERLDETSSDSGISSNSDFYSVSSTRSLSSSTLDERPGTARSIDSTKSFTVDVELPTPVRNGDEPFHALTRQQDYEDEWLECKDIVEHDLTIVCRNVGIGEFIVLQVRRITAMICEYVKAMWDAKNNTKKTSKVFVKVQPIGRDPDLNICFQVTVNICEKDYDVLLDEIKKQNRTLPKDNRIVTAASAIIKLDTKETYQYTLDVTNGEVDGTCIQPFLYQENLHKPKHFKVKCASNDIKKIWGKILVTKQSASIKKKKKAKQIPIEFVQNKVEDITGDKFLNDQYVENILTHKIGARWFIFGIWLGFEYERLETYEYVSMVDASKSILYSWRDNTYTYGETERLNTFIKATFEARMPTLRDEFMSHLVLYVGKLESVRNWTNLYKDHSSENMARFDFGPLRSNAVSPLEPKFFVCVSSRVIDVEHLALKLGLSSIQLSGIKNQSELESDHRKCKMLACVRNTLQSDMNFIKKLMKCLKEDNQTFVIEEITKCVEAWMDSEIGKIWILNNPGKGKTIRQIFPHTNT